MVGAPSASCVSSNSVGLLLPDPCDPNCPEEFKQRSSEHPTASTRDSGSKDIDFRNELLRFIGDFANWDNSANPTFVEAARGLVRAAHGDEAPLVVDPFAGGGSIPLEALRLGCDAFAADLNPIAYVILRTLLEDIPRNGSSLADDLRKTGAHVKETNAKQLAAIYPGESDQAVPLAYLWARTAVCDGCGAEIPLIRSFWLCTKTKRKLALKFDTLINKGGPSRLRFQIFEPKTDAEVRLGNISRGSELFMLRDGAISRTRKVSTLA